MKHSLLGWLLFSLLLGTSSVTAQKFNNRALKGAVKTVQAFTITDQQMTDYVKEYINWMDTNNPVCEPDNAYSQRLSKLTAGMTDAEGIPLNFKVYNVTDVNAFACPDGSIRIFSSLMDIMSDDELLGVIGHEIGHIAHRDSKNAFRQSLLSSALKDAIASQSDKAAVLTDSQLGELSEALCSATFSQKQERAADDYGYEFLKGKGKSPRAMTLSFKKLKKMEDEMGVTGKSKVLQLFSTHPDLDKRIERMEERAQKEGI